MSSTEDELKQTKLHLEYLRRAIADMGKAETEGFREDMDALWSQMDEATRSAVNRDVVPLVLRGVGK